MGYERHARWVAVVSGKGGVGKTMIAANLAAALAKAGRTVLVIDSDLGLANLDVMLGIQPSRTLHDVLQGVCPIEEALIRVGGFEILPAGSGVFEATTLTASSQEHMQALLQTLDARYDILLFDAGAGIGEVVLFFARLADDVLLVVTPEPTSLTDAYATMKVLARQYGRTEVAVVANQVRNDSSETAGAAISMHLQRVVSKFLDTAGAAPLRLHLLGAIQNDPAVPRAIAGQQLLAIAAPDAPATRAIAAVAHAFCALRPFQDQVPS